MLSRAYHIEIEKFGHMRSKAVRLLYIEYIKTDSLIFEVLGPQICRSDRVLLLAELSEHIHMVRICLQTLIEIILAVQLHKNLLKLSVILFIHGDIHVIIPWNETLVTSRSKQCARAQPPFYIVLLTYFSKCDKHLQHFLLVPPEGRPFWIILSHIYINY